MHIIISKEDLAKALSIASSVVGRKTPMPILVNLLFNASGNHLQITASDLEITIIANVKAKVLRPGSTTVNAKVFSEIVRELSDGEIELKLKSQERLEIAAGKSQLNMICISAEEYPGLPGVNFDVSSKVNASILSEMISKTIYAVSNDETRFVLNGVCLASIAGDKKAPGVFQLVTTDGNRLSIVSRTVSGINLGERKVVPSKGLLELRKLLDQVGDTDVGIGIQNGFFVVTTEASNMSMRLVDGEFPDYSQVIPKPSTTIVHLKSDLIVSALKRVVLMVTDKNKCVKFEFSNANLKLSSSSPELGDACEEIPCDYKGDTLVVGFNAKFFIDFVAASGNEQDFILELNGALGPGKMYPESDHSFINVVMPMRLN